MTIMQKLRAKLVICQVAYRQGISPARCRKEIADTIAEAWASDDPQTKAVQIRLVGDLHIPTPEELIVLVSKMPLV